MSRQGSGRATVARTVGYRVEVDPADEAREKMRSLRRAIGGVLVPSSTRVSIA